MRSSDDVSFLDFRANRSKAIVVQCSPPVSFDDASGRETEHACRDGTAAAMLLVVLRQVILFGLVDSTMAKSPFVCRLVEDHSIVHVIASIRYHGDNGVGAVREIVQPVLVMKRRPDDWSLTALESVQFVVGPVFQRDARRAHGLLAHLTLLQRS